ncbi:MAG: Crp/Fnr family transcriptional regulator [Flavobacteriales bacterium]|nr:Crp/Fnr family transcriptional regulator [Flavobacteriales bacterium]
MSSSRLNNIQKLLHEHCSPEWLDLLAFKSEEKIYPSESFLLKEGEEVEHIYIILSGKVKVFATEQPNEERIIRLAGDGYIVGHRSFGKNFNFPVSAKTLTTTTVLQIPIQVFQNLLKANNLFCYHFLMFMAEELKDSEIHIKELTNNTVLQRVTKVIKINAEVFGYSTIEKNMLSFTLSRKDIANFAGTTYETVIRTLNTLEKMGVIKTNKKNLYILNSKELHKIIEQKNVKQPAD